MKAIVTVIGRDRVGIIADVSQLLAQRGVNVLDISQTVLQRDAPDIKCPGGRCPPWIRGINAAIPPRLARQGGRAAAARVMV